MAETTHTPRLLPKNALSKIRIGQSFAEYDKVLLKDGVFVRTPALEEALNFDGDKCFFVGRRGTGKTAIALFVNQKEAKNATMLLPRSFAPSQLPIDLSRLRDTRGREFRSLVLSFRRALLDEIAATWLSKQLLSYNRFPPVLSRERNYIEEYDFDGRFITFADEFISSIETSNDKEWQKLARRAEDVSKYLAELHRGPAWNCILLIDRVDDYWDRSDSSVIFLMALMHACIEINADVEFVRPLVFLRENIFDRVRAIDNEFARIETSVVSLDWSRPHLLEMIERRLNVDSITKLKLNGETWNYFFENWDGKPSYEYVFSFCQERPRDILTYCAFCVDSAQGQKHERIMVEDIQEARRRFSDTRLKDVADEYAENYPNLAVVLTKFYGLGNVFTVGAIESLVKKLILDPEIKANCPWFFSHSTPHDFIKVMYNIGFFGLRGSNSTSYRSIGAKLLRSHL